MSNFHPPEVVSRRSETAINPYRAGTDFRRQNLTSVVSNSRQKCQSGTLMSYKNNTRKYA